MFEDEYTTVQPFFIRDRVQRLQRRLFEAGLRRRHHQRAWHTMRLIDERQRIVDRVAIVQHSDATGARDSGINLARLLMASVLLISLAAVALVFELVAARVFT